MKSKIKIRKSPRADVRQQCDDFAAELADQLHTVIADHVDSLLFAAKVDAIARVQGAFAVAFGGEPTTPAQVVEAPPVSPRHAKRAKSVVAAKIVVAAKPTPSKVPGQATCSKCGTPGHNARSCGRAPKHNGPTDNGRAERPWAAALARTREARTQLDTYEADA